MVNMRRTYIGCNVKLCHFKIVRNLFPKKKRLGDKKDNVFITEKKKRNQEYL